MFYQFFSYVRFLITATNQYGVHSPFVYNYLTKCLYKRSRFKGSKSKRILFKSIDYFNIKHVSIPREEVELYEQLKKLFPSLAFNQAIPDLVYVPQPDFSIISEKNWHNNTVVYIDQIHQSKKKLEEWNKLILLPQLTVTIDLYYCGLVFFRKEQVKEHFKIRI